MCPRRTHDHLLPIIYHLVALKEHDKFPCGLLSTLFICCCLRSLADALPLIHAVHWITTPLFFFFLLLCERSDGVDCKLMQRRSLSIVLYLLRSFHASLVSRLIAVDQFVSLLILLRHFSVESTPVSIPNMFLEKNIKTILSVAVICVHPTPLPITSPP